MYFIKRGEIWTKYNLQWELHFLLLEGALLSVNICTISVTIYPYIYNSDCGLDMQGSYGIFEDV
jgi:hypothetical protein